MKIWQQLAPSSRAQSGHSAAAGGAGSAGPRAGELGVRVVVLGDLVGGQRGVDLEPGQLWSEVRAAGGGELKFGPCTPVEDPENIFLPNVIAVFGNGHFSKMSIWKIRLGFPVSKKPSNLILSGDIINQPTCTDLRTASKCCALDVRTLCLIKS